MWVLKTEADHTDVYAATLAKNFSLDYAGYILRIKKKKGLYYMQGIGFAKDEHKLKEIVKEKTFIKSYVNGNFAIVEMKVPKLVERLYEPDIIFLKPLTYTADGKEHLEIASWTKEPLMEVLAEFKKAYKVKILSFKKEEVSNISIIGTKPKLTDKQKLAFRLAVINGYYDFPKKVKLEQLADMMGVSFSTYRAHLSKAEKEVTNFTFNKIID